jgi:hypothetical protein
MVYFHPWEIHPDQPGISAPLKSRLRHYTNLNGMQKKIECLLSDFRFSTVSEVCKTMLLNPKKISRPASLRAPGG